MAKSDKTPLSGGSELRGTGRLIHHAAVRVWHPAFSEKLMKIRDFSETGAFLFCDSNEMPPLGSVIKLQVQGLAEAAPVVEAKLVRYGENGVGVVFCEE